MWMRKSFSIRERRQKEADKDESEDSASREEEEESAQSCTKASVLSKIRIYRDIVNRP